MQQQTETLCAWCLDAAGLEATQGESHGICEMHTKMMLEKLAARRRASVKTVNFVLVETPAPAPLSFSFIPHTNRKPYPSNWSRVSWLVRRHFGFRCAWCGSSFRTRCHHIGADYADGKPGNSHDKHDLRWPENLICLCQECEKMAEEWDV